MAQDQISQLFGISAYEECLEFVVKLFGRNSDLVIVEIILRQLLLSSQAFPKSSLLVSSAMNTARLRPFYLYL